MSHDTVRYVCGPDLDGNRCTKNETVCPTKSFHDMFFYDMFCFTICLFISPDLDGNRGTTNETMCPERPTFVKMQRLDLILHA
jgi:hypothetical protein